MLIWNSTDFEDGNLKLVGDDDEVLLSLLSMIFLLLEIPVINVYSLSWPGRGSQAFV